MLPEIEYIRRTTDRITTPEELARKFPAKSKAAIDKSLSRALLRKHITKVGYGEYAHPDYQSAVAPPKPQPKSAWKQSSYAALIGLILVGDQLDKKNHNDIYWLEFTRNACKLMRDSWYDEQIKEFCTYMKEAMKELDQSDSSPVKNFTSNISSKDLYELITNPDS